MKILDPSNILLQECLNILIILYMYVLQLSTALQPKFPLVLDICPGKVTNPSLIYLLRKSMMTDYFIAVFCWIISLILHVWILDFLNLFESLIVLDREFLGINILMLKLLRSEPHLVLQYLHEIQIPDLREAIFYSNKLNRNLELNEN